MANASTHEIISSPLRILVLTPQSTAIPSILKDPILPLSTPYYSATIPIWHDILPLSAPELHQWEEEWKGEDAGEVVRAVGAWVVVLRKAVREGTDGGTEATLPQIRASLSTISRLREHHATLSPYSIASVPILLAVGVHQPLSPRLKISTEEWEDLCRGCGGWEWVDGELGGKEERNEFGEKTGLPRLLEALEANEWSSTAEPHDSGDSSGDSEFNDPLFSAGLDSDVRSVDFDVPELRTALIDKQKAERGEEQKDGERGGEDGDAQVRELESMMMKMQAVKVPLAMTEDMPSATRKKFAAKAVRDILGSG